MIISPKGLPTREEIEPILLDLLASPYVQWVLLHIVAWTVALYAVALSLRFLGVVGVIVAGVAVGGIVGLAQAWLLRRVLPINPRAWAKASAIGSLLGLIPVGVLFVVWLLLTLVIGVNWVLLMMGAIFGGIFGAMQARYLHTVVYERAVWWVIANVFAGALCAPLSLTGTTFWLPVFCSLGPVTFGVITVLALRYILRLEIEE